MGYQFRSRPLRHHLMRQRLSQVARERVGEPVAKAVPYSVALAAGKLMVAHAKLFELEQKIPEKKLRRNPKYKKLVEEAQYRADAIVLQGSAWIARNALRAIGLPSNDLTSAPLVVGYCRERLMIRQALIAEEANTPIQQELGAQDRQQLDALDRQLYKVGLQKTLGKKRWLGLVDYIKAQEKKFVVLLRAAHGLPPKARLGQ
jgi:hypothetical protein